MGLSHFIRSNTEQIITEWEHFARAHIPGDDALNQAELQDHVRDLLSFLADDLDEPDSAAVAAAKDKAVDVHVRMRFLRGFDGSHMAAEYRALRAALAALWERKRAPTTEQDFRDLVKCNDAIDQLLMDSFTRYMENLTRARSLFLGTLIHDMRSPLGAVQNCTQLLLAGGRMDDDQRRLVTQIEKSADRLNRLVSDLIDATRLRLGKKIPVMPAPMDMVDAVRKAAQEAEAAHPGHEVLISTEGDLKGEWDSARVSQILSNLICNAIQHGGQDTPVRITARGTDADEVMLSVQNSGFPIPAAILPHIFDPLTRGGDAGGEGDSTGLGLGLFITKELVDAHGGEIGVTSSEKDGTVFTVRLPKSPRRRKGDRLH
jgi:signal transduction histidine kinase